MSERKDKIYDSIKKRLSVDVTEKELFAFLIEAVSLVTKTINSTPIVSEHEGENIDVGSSNSYFPSGW